MTTATYTGTVREYFHFGRESTLILIDESGNLVNVPVSARSFRPAPGTAVIVSGKVREIRRGMHVAYLGAVPRDAIDLAPRARVEVAR